MSTYSRRFFLGAAAASTASLAAPAVLKSASLPRVVVVGGGFSGATLAKYLRLWSAGSVEVLLVERKANHYSCVMSNLVLNNRLKLSALRFSYDSLEQQHGVQVLRDKVLEVDGPGARVRLKKAGWLAYDRLALAPGIRFKKVPGWDAAATPHAWIAGGQTNLLRRQLRDMPDNGTFVMTVPQAPYRCPPGPYERACLVADLLGRRSGALAGKASPAATPKVVVLDGNPGIQAEKETFTRAFEKLYGNIVDYRPNAVLQAVDSVARVAVTSVGEFQGDVLNVIPTHKAAQVVTRAGLTDGGRWAPVDELSYESKLPNFSGVHIVGDSQASGQPKSGHMANAQAKVCADAILRSLAGEPVDTAERRANVTTNSACFSPITYDKASWLTAAFAYDPAKKAMQLVPGSLGEAESWNKDNFETMFAWSDNLFADTFG